jgi:hypothetical protein
LFVDSADLSAGATLAIQINDAATVKADQLAVTNALNITNAKLVISVTGTPTEASYTIATADSITGSFLPANVTGLPAGYDLVQTSTEIRIDQVAGGYAAWVTANNVTQGENGDDDNDGLSNLVEYALGLNPQASSVPAGTFVGNLLTFVKGPEAKAAGDVTYTIQTSTSLGAGSWTTVTATDTVDDISYLVPANEPGGKLFARLVVTKP